MGSTSLDVGRAILAHPAFCFMYNDFGTNERFTLTQQEFVMAHQVYLDRIVSYISGAIAEARSVSQINHPGLRGRIREIAVDRIFRPVLPNYVNIGTGKIINPLNAESPEIDLVFYSKELIAPLMYTERDGLFPIESCFYALEVKSCVTTTELRTSIEKARNLRCIHQLAQPGIQAPLIDVISAFFAFDSDITSNRTELERYRELDNEANTNPVIRVICVIGKGYWHFSNHPQKGWIWHEFRECDGYKEVLSFITGIMNTIPGIRTVKPLPQLGYYLFEV